MSALKKWGVKTQLLFFCPFWWLENQLCCHKSCVQTAVECLSSFESPWNQASMGCFCMTLVTNIVRQKWLKPPASKSKFHCWRLDFHPHSWFSNHHQDGDDEMGGFPTMRTTFLGKGLKLTENLWFMDAAQSRKGLWQMGLSLIRKNFICMQITQISKRKRWGKQKVYWRQKNQKKAPNKKKNVAKKSEKVQNTDFHAKKFKPRKVATPGTYLDETSESTDDSSSDD